MGTHQGKLELCDGGHPPEKSTCAMVGAMPSKHGVKSRNLRGVEDHEWERFGELTYATGDNRSAVLRRFIQWFVGDTDELPERPEWK